MRTTPLPNRKAAANAFGNLGPGLTCAALVLLLWSGGYSRRVQLIRQGEHAKYSCGPLCLAKALSLLGHSVDPGRCAELASTDANGITTLAGLQRAATALSVPAKGYNLTPSELAMLNHIAILHVSLPLPIGVDHLVVFASTKGNSFQLINPTSSDTMVHYTAEQLRLMWNGDCLVFSPNPSVASLKLGLHRARRTFVLLAGLIAGSILAVVVTRRLSKQHTFPTNRSAIKPKLIITGLAVLAVFTGFGTIRNFQAIAKPQINTQNARLVLGASVLDIGHVQWGKNLQTAIWLANGGRDTLRIDKNKLKSSCSCVGTTLSKAELAPGEKASLHIFFRPPRKMEPFSYSIYVPSNGPQQNGQVLVLKGDVVGPAGVVYPPRIYFDRIAEPEQASKSLLYVLRRPEVHILSVTSDSPLIKASFERVRGAFKIDIMLARLPAPGPFEGTIKIVTNDPEPEGAEILVPFSGLVVKAREHDGSSTVSTY